MTVRTITETIIPEILAPNEVVELMPEGEFGMIEVNGHVDVRGLSIKPGWWLWVGGSLKVGEWLKVGRALKVGESLRVDTWLAAQSVESGHFSVRCSELRTSLMPLWREFYLPMPPLKKYEAVIREECWYEIREALKPDAEGICAWEGWHPLIRAQLQMFLGLRESVPGSEVRV